MCGLLEKSLYGTRDAALNWSEAYTQALLELGFAKGEANPCSFVNAEAGLETVVHGDDFLTIGPEDALQWFDAELAKRFKVKSILMGPKAHHTKQARFLNRIVTWEPEGIMYEPDPRHGELIIRQLGLEKANSLKVPMVREETRRMKKELEQDAEDIVAAVEVSSGACGGSGPQRPWSKEFRECAKRLRGGSAKADYEDKAFLLARREL